jgi:hypothetical protein
MHPYNEAVIDLIQLSALWKSLESSLSILTTYHISTNPSISPLRRVDNNNHHPRRSHLNQRVDNIINMEKEPKIPKLEGSKNYKTWRATLRMYLESLFGTLSQVKQLNPKSLLPSKNISMKIANLKTQRLRLASELRVSTTNGKPTMQKLDLSSSHLFKILSQQRICLILSQSAMIQKGLLRCLTITQTRSTACGTAKATPRSCK